MKKKSSFDVTTNSRSIAGSIKPILDMVNDLSYGELHEKFLCVIDDPTVHASDVTRSYWRAQLSKSRNKTHLMTTMYNLYLAAAGLSIN